MVWKGRSCEASPPSRSDLLLFVFAGIANERWDSDLRAVPVTHAPEPFVALFRAEPRPLGSGIGVSRGHGTVHRLQRNPWHWFGAADVDQGGESDEHEGCGGGFGRGGDDDVVDELINVGRRTHRHQRDLQFVNRDARQIDAGARRQSRCGLS